MTPLSIHVQRKILSWLEVFDTSGNHCKGASESEDKLEDHYRRNLPQSARTFFGGVLKLTNTLGNERQQNFVRLALLSVGQQALDCKTEEPSLGQLRRRFADQVRTMIREHFGFLTSAAAANRLPRWRITQMRRVINRSSESSADDRRIPAEWLPAKLVLTSPPYPGVHVVYHRWQIKGRKETPAPFWLANSRDGAGGAYYCLGPRSEPELKTYFARLRKTFASVRGLIGPDSIVVQLVAFSEPEWQLPAYLKKMDEAGFVELKPLCDTDRLFEGRVWRDVPGRRWYVNRHGQISASKEVVLFHRLADLPESHMVV